MGMVVDPFARCRNPLACRDSGGVADDRDQIAMATGFCPQNAEAVLAIVEGATLAKAPQVFLGRWFLLWPHLCLPLLAPVPPTGFGDLRCARAPCQRRSAREYFR